MKVKGFLFDYGGTLDTAGCHWGKMLWHAYQRQFVPIEEEQFRDAYVFAERTLGKNPIIQPNYTFHKTLETKLRIEFDHLVDQSWLVVPNEKREQYQKAVLEDVYSKVCSSTLHSADVLSRLKKNYQLLMVSNFYGNLPVVLKEFHLAQYFSSVVESAVVGVRKPDERIYQIGLDRIGIPSAEVMVVGDSFKKDIIPAKRLGCLTAWMKGEGWTSDEQVDGTKVDMVIQDIADLLNI